jgi:pilus assembly protein CpaB
LAFAFHVFDNGLRAPTIGIAMILRSRHRVFLFLAGLAMVAASWLLSGLNKAEAPLPVQQTVKTELKSFLLVAKQPIDAGTLLTSEKTEWLALQGKPAPAGAITHVEGEEGVNPYIGRLITQSIGKGEALLPTAFASAEQSGYLAQQITPGKRAYAVAIDTKGTVTAGNFILPNDRVDIIRSYNSSNGLQSETVLTNVRVLAIGQSLHGDGVSSTGDTATVEVDIREAELLATVQRTGQISLALRNPNIASAVDERSRRITIIRAAPVAERTP